jgi:glutamate racemase
LAEEGLIDDPVTDLVVSRYLDPLLKQKIDTLILGCTHYPLLKSTIQKICGEQVQLVDSAKGIVEDMARQFSSEKRGRGSPQVLFYATDFSEHTKLMAERIMSPLVIGRFEVVQL